MIAFWAFVTGSALLYCSQVGLWVSGVKKQWCCTSRYNLTSPSKSLQVQTRTPSDKRTIAAPHTVLVPKSTDHQPTPPPVTCRFARYRFFCQRTHLAFKVIRLFLVWLKPSSIVVPPFCSFFCWLLFHPLVRCIILPNGPIMSPS